MAKTTAMSRDKLMAEVVGRQSGQVRKALLVVEEGPDRGTRFQLAAWESSIGRGASNNFPLTDRTVSTSHALIRYYDNGYVVFDQNSKNGTGVNGKSVEKRLLKDGDAIQLGQTTLRFRFTK